MLFRTYLHCNDIFMVIFKNLKCCFGLSTLLPKICDTFSGPPIKEVENPFFRSTHLENESSEIKLVKVSFFNSFSGFDGKLMLKFWREIQSLFQTRKTTISCLNFNKSSYAMVSVFRLSNKIYFSQKMEF